VGAGVGSDSSDPPDSGVDAGGGGDFSVCGCSSGVIFPDCSGCSGGSSGFGFGAVRFIGVWYSGNHYNF